MPCAGKSTCIDEFKKEHPDYTFFSETYFNLKEDDPILETTIEFYQKEELLKKNKLLEIGPTNKIILDRSFLSTLAFAYAKSRKGSNEDYLLFSNFINNNLNNIIIPDLFLIFLISPDESVKRRQSLINKDTLDIWLDKDFLESMYQYYFSKEYVKLFTNSEFEIIDTSAISIKELFKKISLFIN